MPYTIIALRWRPNNFDEIIGQPHVVNTLKNALTTGKLANAYLFSGPRGVGKTSTARILAKALNCKSGLTANPCGKCNSCLEITQSRSLDVMEIDGASNTGVEDVRVLRENVKFSPTAGKYKIYIIDEVHMLSTPAFNALLKTLEEPPEFVKFIFATTRPDKIPATVLSRCQRLDFRRISVIEMIAQLEKIVKAEGINIDKEVLFAIAKASDGALRDAESILDQLAAFAKGKVTISDVVSVLGVVEQEALFEITYKIIQKDAAQALGLLNKLVDEGKDMAVFLSNLTEHFRNLMVAKITRADSKLIDLPQEICERLLKQSQEFTLDEIFSSFNILVNAQELGKRLESIRIPLEITLVRMCHEKKGTASGHTQPQKYNNEAPAVPTQRPQVVNPPVKQEEAPKEASPLITLDEIKACWQNVVDNLGKVKMYLSSYLEEGEPLKIQADTLTISFPESHSLHKESLEKKENKAIVEKVLQEILNKQVRVAFILSHEHKPKEDSGGGAALKSALDVFGGRVVRED